MYSSTAGRQDHSGRRPSNALAIWLVLALALLPIGAAALFFGQSASSERLAAIDETTGLRLFEIRNRMTWLHHDLLTDGLLADLNGTEIDDDRVALFEAQRAAVMDEIEEIVAGGTEWSGAAIDLQTIYDWDEFVNRPYQAWDLDEQHYLSMSSSEVPELAAEWPEHDAQAVNAMLPRLILVDAITVALMKRDVGPSEWSSSFVQDTYGTLVGAPGWLGPDREAPLTENMMSNPSDASASQNLGIETTAALAELRLVWDYDQWLIVGAQSRYADQPPMSIEQVTLAANASVSALRGDAMTAIDGDVEQISSAAPSQSTVTIWYTLGGGAILLGLVIAIALIVRLLGRHRTLAESALTDPLTGAKNRRYLDTEVFDRCGAAGGRHVLVMVDLDRFKLVNDTWGHDVGDALLRTLTDRLDETTASLIEGRSDMSASIIRTGGDEFVVVLHADDPIDATVIEQRLRGLTGPLDLGLDDLIHLEFSLGIVEAFGPVDLASLLKTADLAAYEDKKQRATDRKIETAQTQRPITIEIP